MKVGDKMPTLLQLSQSYNNPDSINYKLAYLRKQMEQQLLNLGDLAYEDQVQLAMLGDTIIIGGYLNTELIAADSILTKHLAAGAVTSDKIAAGSVTTDILAAGAVTSDKIDVNTLSAISANIGEITAGSLTGVTITGSTIRTAASGTRAEMGGGSTPYFDTYLGNIRRMRLASDRLNFYDDEGKGTSYVQAIRYKVADILDVHRMQIISPNEIVLMTYDGSDDETTVTASNGFFSVHNASSIYNNSTIYMQNGIEFAVQNNATLEILNHSDLIRVTGNMSVSGSLSKGSGTFLIDHPLDPDNKDLVHGFVESPKYELIYRGKVQLVDGVAEVDIDAMCDMSEGTFEALTQNAEVVSLCNLTGFARVKPTKIIDGKFTIVAEEKVSDEISWVVIAERADYFIVNGDRWTDEKGRLIPEHNKPEQQESDGKSTIAIGTRRHENLIAKKERVIN